MAKVLIVCGGTGGHLTPGIAIAEALSAREHACTLVVSRKKVDSRLIQNYPSMEFIEAPGAPFSFRPLVFLRFLWMQCCACIFAIHLLSKKKPDLILGFGGFLSAGIALPGFLRGIPFALHEANRVVGRSNRLLSRLADRVFLPVGVQLKGGRADRILHVGLPLRKEFICMKKEVAREQLGIHPSEKLLVIFGGSQGASSLNEWAQVNCQALAEKGVSIYCLTGLRKELPCEVVSDTDSFGSVRSWFMPFSDTMPAVLSAADAVISRAGAGSIAEIIRTQAPSILVPYPFARDDHQTANARFVQNKDAALVVEETQFASLLDEVVELLFDNSRLEILCQNLKALDRPEEVNLLADALEELMANRQAKHTHSPVPSKEA